MRTRKQSGTRRIFKVCKEHACVSTVNTCSQNSVKTNNDNSNFAPSISWLGLKKILFGCPPQLFG